jgi:Skp family chaperone for outer membrane proteins
MEEGAALAGQAAATMADAGLLASQLGRQREISAALSAEHDRRDAEAAALEAELADTRERLAKTAGQRNLFLAVIIALGLAVAGYAAIRVLRFLRVIPV